MRWRMQYGKKSPCVRILLDFLRLDEEAPSCALTLAEWSSPVTLSSLRTYSDHIYRNQPTLPREQKPLLSLWAQWYIGLLVPPLMLALLSEEQTISLAPEHFRVKGSMKPARGLLLDRRPLCRQQWAVAAVWRGSKRWSMTPCSR